MLLSSSLPPSTISPPDLNIHSPTSVSLDKRSWEKTKSKLGLSCTKPLVNYGSHYMVSLARSCQTPERERETEREREREKERDRERETESFIQIQISLDQGWHAGLFNYRSYERCVCVGGWVVQSHFYVKPNFGNVKLSWGLTIDGLLRN